MRRVAAGPYRGGMTSGLITHLLQSYGYYAVFALIALESMGLPLPGESALIAAALYAGTTHHLSVVVLAAVAAAAAIIGDNAGYWIGRTGGKRLAERYGRYVGLDRAKLKVGRYLFDRYGGKVVFFGRFVAILRTFAAFFAGVSAMRWSVFLVANAAGGVAWSGLYAFGAYALGSAAASSVTSTISIAGYVIASVFTVVTFVATRVSLRRLEQRAEAAFPEEADEPKKNQQPDDPERSRGLTRTGTPASVPALRHRGLIDPDEVARRVAEGAVAHAPRLRRRLGNDLAARVAHRGEDGVEVGRGEVRAVQTALGDERGDGVDVRRRALHVVGEDDRDPWLGPGTHGDPAETVPRDVVAQFEAERVAVERERAVGVVDEDKAASESEIHASNATESASEWLL
jgi:membrane protein DedA with SNARE-associated domain